MLKLAVYVSLFCSMMNIPFLQVRSKLPYAALNQDLSGMDHWVDSVFNSMDDDRRLGQLFMQHLRPRQGAEKVKYLAEQVTNNHVGGVIFFQGNPTQIANFGNYYQSLSKTPLMVAIDGEWGPNMRIDSTVAYPRQMTLGAIKDNKLIYDFGVECARQCRRLGIHINFAPVVDINNNSSNPVIAERSFGEDRINVTAKAYQYAMGLQDYGVMACAKHFPGHGDTDVDSHLDIPVIRHDLTRLDSIELFPFRLLAKQGLQSIMIGHLSIPSMDATPNLPSTLSPNIVRKTLKDKIGFEGLIFTDAMDMKGVSKHHKTGVSDLRALIAGVDVLLMTEDVYAAKAEIKAAIARGELSWNDIYDRTKKILRAKYRLGLNKYKPVDVRNLYNDLNTIEAIKLKERLLESSLTLAKNNHRLLPILRPDTLRISAIAINASGITSFNEMLSNFTEADYIPTAKEISPSTRADYLSRVRYNNLVVVSLHGMSRKPQDNFGLSNSAIEFVNKLASQKNVLLVNFGSPYALKFFPNIPTVIQVYTEDVDAQTLAAQAIFGAKTFNGFLPVTPGNGYHLREGHETVAHRLPFGKPRLLGFNEWLLEKKIDSIANVAINIKACPGLQVLVVKDQQIAFHKTYGHHTYDQVHNVKKNDIYDLASVTKICATTLSLMKLYDEGKLDLEKNIGFYIPELKGTNKEWLLVREILAHQAGLKAWIPFYTSTLDAGKRPDPKYYRTKPEGDFIVKVDENLYMHKTYMDTLWHKIITSDVSSNKGYVYSDLGLILSMRLVEKISGMTLDQYVKTHYYEPMGLIYTGYNPLSRFPKNAIIPSENDSYFRYCTVQGCVHDMAAAMLGGVAGHAGLFSTPSEVAVLLQMLLNKGEIFGLQYLKPETIQKFTQYYNYPNTRRGLGFDKPEPNRGPKYGRNNTAWQCSDMTFGHTGFTGIGVWSDPQYNLTFIFMSNRTFPNMENRKLITNDIREKMHDAIYKSLGL